MPIDPDEVAAAIRAHPGMGRRQLLAADAIRLLTVMFANADVCNSNLDSLTAAGFSRATVIRLLRAFVDTGLVAKERGAGRPNTYRLLMPRRRP